MTNQFINKKGYIDKPYRVLFKNQNVNVYAKSEKAAKQKAIEHFKPKKNEIILILIKSF